MEKLRKLFTLLFMGVLIVSCGVAEPIPTATATVTETLSPIPVMPNASPTIQLATWTPSLPNTPTPSITLTQLPTLSVQEAQDRIKELLETNGGCELPCWWGLIPGTTRIFDARNYLNSFQVLSIGKPLYNDEWNYLTLHLPQSNNLYLHIATTFKGEKDKLEWLQVSLEMQYKVTNDEEQSWYEISWNDPALAEVVNQYSLQNILSAYGEPSDILIFTHQTGLLNRALPVSIVLFYPQHGFMIEYVTDGQIISDNIIGCPSLAFPNFWFWSPSEQITMDDVVSTISGYQIDHESIVNFKTIQDATGMNIDEFYSSFKADKNKCIETAKNRWPLPGQ